MEKAFLSGRYDTSNRCTRGEIMIDALEYMGCIVEFDDDDGQPRSASDEPMLDLDLSDIISERALCCQLQPIFEKLISGKH